MPIIKVISLSSHGLGLSGGDRIWIEFVHEWSKTQSVSLITWSEGIGMFNRQKVKQHKRLIVTLLKNRFFSNFGFFVSYLARIMAGIYWALTVKNDYPAIIYSSSEFWMDLLPAFILKMRNKNNIWVATWYQTALNPLSYIKVKKTGLLSLSASAYWLSQMLVKPLVNHFSDYVLVNNQLERLQFKNLNRKNKVLVVLGAVGLEEIGIWKRKHNRNIKKYDAVYQGRFHPQKGVTELISIWEKVCKNRPSAKLVMIGDGPLMKKVKEIIKQKGLEENIILKGYIFDGAEKYQTFAESKIVLHPALFDSGGMAAAEAMAFGLPAIGFNLSAYKSYYPKGMVKVRQGDMNGFSRMILRMLSDKNLRNKIGQQGEKYIYENWSWDKRANEVRRHISP